MKYCTHCGAQIEDDAFVCVQCGCKVSQEVRPESTASRIKFCSYCGATLKEGADVCLSCGRKVENGRPIEEVKPSNGSNVLTIIAKVLMILSCVGFGIGGVISLMTAIAFAGPDAEYVCGVYFFITAVIYLIPLAWAIPLTVHVFKASKENATISTGTKVCILIFVNIIAGILLLCRTEPNRKN